MTDKICFSDLMYSIFSLGKFRQLRGFVVRLLSLVNYVYVVEYDLPTENPSRRVYFYQKVHKMFLKHFSKPIEFSSYSCYFSEDEEVAKAFYGIAKEFCSRVAIYKAQELEGFGKSSK